MKDRYGLCSLRIGQSQMHPIQDNDSVRRKDFQLERSSVCANHSGTAQM